MKFKHVAYERRATFRHQKRLQPKHQFFFAGFFVQVAAIP